MAPSESTYKQLNTLQQDPHAIKATVHVQYNIRVHGTKIYWESNPKKKEEKTSLSTNSIPLKKIIPSSCFVSNHGIVALGHLHIQGSVNTCIIIHNYNQSTSNHEILIQVNLWIVIIILQLLCTLETISDVRS